MDKRLKFRYKLHERYAVQAYDNADVWAGNLTVELDGSGIARANAAGTRIGQAGDFRSGVDANQSRLSVD